MPAIQPSLLSFNATAFILTVLRVAAFEARRGERRSLREPPRQTLNKPESRHVCTRPSAWLEAERNERRVRQRSPRNHCNCKPSARADMTPAANVSHQREPWNTDCCQLILMSDAWVLLFFSVFSLILEGKVLVSLYILLYLLISTVMGITTWLSALLFSVTSDQKSLCFSSYNTYWL